MIYINPYRFGDVNENVFLGLIDMDWFKAGNWSKGTIPTSTEKAIVRSNCNLSYFAEVDKLIVDNGCALNCVTGNSILTINNDCEINGLLDLNGNGGLILKGFSNVISNYIFGGAGTIAYGRNGNQNVLNLEYRNLQILGSGIKSFISDIVVLGNTTIDSGSTLELGSYNVEFKNEIKYVSADTGSLVKSSSVGYTKTKGIRRIGTVSFPSNYEVENTGGTIEGANISNYNFVCKWKFTTENSVLIGYADGIIFNNAVTIVGVDVTGFGSLTINYGLNGVDSLSRFVNRADLFINVNSKPMALGVLVLDSGSNTMYYNFNGSIGLWYSNYWNLGVNGSGIKTLSNDTTLLGNLVGNGSLELGSYNFTINGYIGSLGRLLKTTSSVGLTKIINGIQSPNALSVWDFSGNGDVEIGGVFQMNPDGGPNAYFNGGTGQFKIISNLSFYLYGLPSVWVFNFKILIDVSVVVSFPRMGISDNWIFTNEISCVESSAVLDNKTKINLQYNTAPLMLGSFINNGEFSSVAYNLMGNQDVKDGTYRVLEFGGSGVKKLLGNIIINSTDGGSWSITGTATIDYNGFTITTI